MSLRDRSVLVTGHTGFKGAWLSIWLSSLGAHVHGYAIEPPTEPNLFEVARVGDLLASDTRGDVRDASALRGALARSRPEVVFHLAAQSLVVEGYREPASTVATNVLGTANVLDAIRTADSVRAAVIIATDKVYANLEAGRPFREEDPLGGHDPYSASKASAELIVASFRASYFGAAGHPARIASARAGNVIGGGDWAADRLVPDCLRAFGAGEPARIRHPGAVRPWQHVLGPLSGYLAVAEALLADDSPSFARAWNFGPDEADDATVEDVATRLATLWGEAASVVTDTATDWPEAGLLRLDSGAARTLLGWRPRWRLAEALERTVDWHRAWLRGEDMLAVSRRQIGDHAGAVT